MLSPFTLSLLHFLLGVLVGIYLPLAALYFVLFIRKAHLGLHLIWEVILRLALAVFGFFLVFLIIGLVLPNLGELEQLEKYNIWLGFGAIIAFFAGVFLFLVSLWKARRMV
ncbi:MAG: hypothetical protein ACXW1W_14960 [Methylococcaceae bacterium]